MMMMMMTATTANIYICTRIREGESAAYRKNKEKKQHLLPVHTLASSSKPFDVVEKGKSVHT
jgi:hypothetical protein